MRKLPYNKKARSQGKARGGLLRYIQQRRQGDMGGQERTQTHTNTYTKTEAREGRSVLGQRATVGGEAEVVAPPLWEVVRGPRRAEHGEVEDERDDLSATVECRSENVAGRRGNVESG